MRIPDCVTITPELVNSFALLIPSSLLDELRVGRVLGLGSLLAEKLCTILKGTSEIYAIRSALLSKDSGAATF